MTRCRTFLPSAILLAVGAIPPLAASDGPPKVMVIGTGGTISAGAEPATGRPRSLSATDLVGMVASLEDQVVLEEEDFVRIGSSSMTPEIQFRLAGRVREIFARRPDLSGIVITHGTDSLEETAYFLDLLHTDSRPIVMTAAQRPPRVPDSDGPRNLEAAIRTAISPRARNKGVLVVLNDEIHSARYVSKTHSVAVESFQSGRKGIVGVVDDGRVIVYNEPLNRIRIETSRVEPEVDLIRLAVGDQGKFIRHAVESRSAGIVLEVFGRGNMPAPVIEAVRKARQEEVAVVVVSRTREGRVDLPETLRKAGVIEGEDIPGLKARVLLMLALGATRDVSRIQAWFRSAAGAAE